MAKKPMEIWHRSGKSIFIPLGRQKEYAPPHPERTSIQPGRSLWGDYEIKEWPTREAMINACRKGDRGIGSNGPRPYLKEDRELYGL